MLFLRRTVERNSTQLELVRLYSMLRTESLFAGYPVYEYFRDRDERVLSTFGRMLDGTVEDPAPTARQLLALMGGLEEQWLRSPDVFDPVARWERAVAAVLGPRRSSSVYRCRTSTSRCRGRPQMRSARPARSIACSSVRR